MIITWYLLIYFLHFCLTKSQINNKTHTLSNGTVGLFAFDHPHITILGALTTNEHIRILNEHTNQLHRTLSNQEIYLASKAFILDSNPLLVTMKLCEIGNQSHAKAIVVGRGLDENDLTLTAISYVSDFYQIPVVAIAARENLFSDKVKYLKRVKKTIEFTILGIL